MNIYMIDYSAKTKSLDIFVSGCNPPYCSGCCNPELIDFDNGTSYKSWINKIKDYISDYGSFIDNIFLVGGSFNHQNEDDLICFFEELNKIKMDKQVWLFARESITNIKPLFYKNCDYIKCGEYKPELKCNDNVQFGVKLATSNQVIYAY